jgi:hypothetical protein
MPKKQPKRAARRRPTRADLLVVVARLQDLVSNAYSASCNDRDPDQLYQLRKPLRTAFDLCVDATAHDPPIEMKGPWSE